MFNIQRSQIYMARCTASQSVTATYSVHCGCRTVLW